MLADEVNPAVDYRLPGGLSFSETKTILRKLVDSKMLTGISVTIFNPVLDKDGAIAKHIASTLVRALS